MDPCKTPVCGAARICSVAYFWKGRGLSKFMEQVPGPYRAGATRRREPSIAIQPVGRS
jgi:hypothetical protein